MYFYYGIKHSSLEEGQDIDGNNIELRVTDDSQTQSKYASQSITSNPFNKAPAEPAYTWEDPDKLWDQSAVWSDQPSTQSTTFSEPKSSYTGAWAAAPSAGSAAVQPQYSQVETQYNMNTNNTRSVINKPAKPAPPPAPRRQDSKDLFISEQEFPKWED